MQTTSLPLSAPRLDILDIIRRASSLLETAQDIQPEARADYWFKAGLRHKDAEEWQCAYWCFEHAIKIDTSHWRGWLCFGLCCAHLEKIEQCNNSILGAEIHGRPTRESDFFAFYTPLELDYLCSFLHKHENGDTKQQVCISLSLIYFHIRDFELAGNILIKEIATTIGQDSWKQYFLSRIEFEKGDVEKSILALKLPLPSEFIKNPRVQFWLGRSYTESVLLLNNKYWVFSEDGYYLPSNIEQRIKFGITHLESAIAIGPVRAEYYFKLGQAKQLLESDQWSGSGAGLHEYHAAVKLEPSNQQYIMARASAASWAFHLGESEVLELVARVEAADISIDSQPNLMEDLYDTGNYASCLLLFNKINNELDYQIVLAESKREHEMQWLAECITNLGGIPSMKKLQFLAEIERAGWKEKLVLQGL